MSVTVDSGRGRSVSEVLYKAFSTTGIHGRTGMPEDILPKGMVRGSIDHRMFITLTVSIDYQRDAPALWESSRRTYDDSTTRYLFDPKSLHETPMKMIIADMQKHGLSRKPRKDAHIWKTVGVTFYKKWDGDPLNFLGDCGWDAPTILRRLKSDVHPMGSRLVHDYLYLRGNKIGPLWLRMLRDNVGITRIRNLSRVSIPVDVHVARATLAVGVVRGRFRGRLSHLFEHIREAWFESEGPGGEGQTDDTPRYG